METSTSYTSSKIVQAIKTDTGKVGILATSVGAYSVSQVLKRAANAIVNLKVPGHLPNFLKEYL